MPLAFNMVIVASHCRAQESVFGSLFGCRTLNVSLAETMCDNFSSFWMVLSAQYTGSMRNIIRQNASVMAIDYSLQSPS